MYIIPANFGNDSVALIEWAHQNDLGQVSVVYIDTGWAAPEWPARVSACQKWAAQLGFANITLKPKADFVNLMRERGSFPTRKFQWCAGFLKGLPLLAWLDQNDIDPGAEATIMLAHRREASPTLFDLPEFIEESEHYGQRCVWHPLWAHDKQQMLHLVEQSSLPVLAHRSLECDPCVNSDVADFLRMAPQTLKKGAALELEMSSQLLDPSIYQGQSNLVEARCCYQKENSDIQSADLFSMGCGSPFGCGL